MTSLPWVLYLADVANGVKGLAMIASALALFSAAFFVTMRFIERKDNGIFSDCKFGSKVAITILCVTAATAVLTPSKNTVYAIAAVSVGYELAATPTANKARRAVDAWLDRQIEGGK